MINNLIKTCQEKDGFNGCEDCGHCVEEDNEHLELLCLEELIEVFNTKYGDNYVIINKNIINKIKELLDYEC